MQGNNRKQGNQPEQYRNVQLTVRVTPDEAAWIKNDAWKNRMSMAEYMRVCIFAHQKPKIPAEIGSMLSSLIYEVNKIGNNINQLTKASHGRGYLSQYDRRLLGYQMDALTEELEKIERQIEVIAQDGDNKAFPS